jgi:hypothetical protein
MRIGVSSRGNMWVSMGCLGWAVAWVVLLPVIAAWLAIKVLILLGKAIIWLIQQADSAPSIPPKLRTPPRR